MKRREVIFLTVALVLGAVVGGLLGELIGSFLPEGAVKTLFMESIDIGIKPFSVEAYALSLTFGLMVKINFVSILMIIFVIIYFRWWYL
jgi:large-conductance mechanosensitive channel